jgi:maleylpyruvate isomerase
MAGLGLGTDATVSGMDRSPEEMLELIDAATRRLLETLRGFTDEDVREPSRLPGWTRGHVLAHLAGGADAIRNMMDGARTGTPATGYASQEARDRAIEDGSRRDARTLADDVAVAAERFRETAVAMPAEAWERRCGS